VVQRSESVLGESHDYVYSYDAHGRLERVQRDGIESESYGYDDNGNRSTASNAGGSRSASHGADDRLLSDGPRSYEHDARGARSAVHDGAGTTSYRYDALGALRSVLLSDGRQLEYVVDGEGRRIGKKVGGVLVQQLFYRDALRPVAMRGASDRALTRFIYGQNLNVPDAMIKDGVAYRLISDAVGSVRLVVNTSDDSVAQRIDYDAFGVVLSDTNPGFQPFGFAGGLYDPDTGLVRFGARDYDPQTGRWTAKDPSLFDDGTNVYAYVGNDPINFNDPTGLNRFKLAGEALKGLGKYGKKAWDAGKKLWNDLNFDGPSAGLKYGNGRVCQVRYKKKPVGRLDYHPYPGTDGESRLHGHLGPSEGHHIPLDPRDLYDWFSQ
jgi:RHS repeat-associated protein